MSRRQPINKQPSQEQIKQVLAYAQKLQPAISASSGGYAGARIDSAQLSRYTPVGGSAVSDVIRDLPMLRARSRDQLRNAPVAIGAVNTTVSHVIGTGLSYTPSIDAEFLGLTDEKAEAWGDNTRRRFNAWANSPDCDLARQLNFYGLQELSFRTMLESGDSPVVTPRIERNGSVRLAIQLIEADRVCNPNRISNTDTMVDGVELDADTGEALAIHIAKHHPGSRSSSPPTAKDWTKVQLRGAGTGRRNAFLVFKPLRPGQPRGIPMVAPIIEPLKQLTRWSDAELNAAVVSSLMPVFVKMDPEAFGDLYDNDAQTAITGKAGQWSGEMQSGQAINLLPGEDITSPAPGRPNPSFDPFWQAMVRQIGMALEMPFEVLVMHFQSSYSAARAALLMAYKAFRSRRDLMATGFCQPIFELWLTDEVAEGRINAPGFFKDPIVRAAWCSAIWTGDGPGSIDPLKEVQAAGERINLGLSTKQAESIAYDGSDWRPKHEQRVKEINAEKAAGIYIQPAGTPVQPQPADAIVMHAVAQLSNQVSALAERPAPTITVHTPPVTVNAGDTHIAPHHITVEPSTTTVNLPEGCVQVQTHVAAPEVIVQNQPAQIAIMPAQAVRESYTRDSEGNLSGKTITPI